MVIGKAIRSTVKAPAQLTECILLKLLLPCEMCWIKLGTKFGCGDLLREIMQLECRLMDPVRLVLPQHRSMFVLVSFCEVSEIAIMTLFDLKFVEVTD